VRIDEEKGGICPLNPREAAEVFELGKRPWIPGVGRDRTMDKQEKTLKGFTVAKRCDICGYRTKITSDTGDRCTLKCVHCGKEYSFYQRRP